MTGAALHIREQVYKAANNGCLPGTSWPHQKDSTHQWVDDRNEQGQFHLNLANQTQEGEGEHFRKASILLGYLGLELATGDKIDQFSERLNGYGLFAWF
jgi:hypothetical protein